MTVIWASEVDVTNGRSGPELCSAACYRSAIAQDRTGVFDEYIGCRCRRLTLRDSPAPQRVKGCAAASAKPPTARCGQAVGAGRRHAPEAAACLQLRRQLEGIQRAGRLGLWRADDAAASCILAAAARSGVAAESCRAAQHGSLAVVALGKHVALRQRVPLGGGAEEGLDVRGGKGVGLLSAPLVSQPGRVGSCKDNVLCADHHIKCRLQNAHSKVLNDSLLWTLQC